MKITLFYYLFIGLSLIALPELVIAQSVDFTIQNIKFESQGISLAGSILTPKKIFAAANRGLRAVAF